MDGAPAIVVHNLGKVYTFSSPLDRVKNVFSSHGNSPAKSYPALADISFTAEKGDTVGIIGRNGSGKTTLLQLISGISQPTSGSVRTHGRISALLGLGAGFSPDFTGRQNVYLGGAVSGLSRQEIDQCFDEIVSFAGLDAFIDQPVKTYSSGMYIRLAFSLALHTRPDILIVDEAIGVGDTLFQAKCFARLRELQKQGITILLVTHSLDLITRFCNKACLLDKGELIAFGSPRDVVATYKKRILSGSPCRSREGDADTVETCRCGNGVVMSGGGGGILFNADAGRYGNGKATLAHVGIYGSDGIPRGTLTRDAEYEFRFRVIFHEQITRPIIAYRIQDHHGVDVCGTNTLYHDLDTEWFRPDEEVQVSFYQKVPLNRGGYFLSASCAGFEDGAYVVYDRRSSALAFTVTADSECTGWVDLSPAITITRKSDVSFSTQF